MSNLIVDPKTQHSRPTVKLSQEAIRQALIKAEQEARAAQFWSLSK